ncbi:hypothetical protein [Oleidesulfovibrio sp.]|uniref:hypothetical protein n=1 Tax=Oleidesulfovibrio sp. TaxID=2909707 RepID=UPI003A8B03D9
MFTDAAAHTMLSALAITQAGLHSAYPGIDGSANELSGGSYTRKSVTLGAAAARKRQLSASVTFDVPAGASVAWLSWRLADGTCVAVSPLGSAASKPVMTDPATDTITCEAHGFSNGQTVVFSGTMPAGIQAGVTYHVRDVTADTFKVAATAGGAVVDITADGAARVSRIIPEAYNDAGTYELTSATLALE